MSWYAKVGLRKPRPGVRARMHKGEYVVSAEAMRMHFDLDQWYRTMALTHE